MVFQIKCVKQISRYDMYHHCESILHWKKVLYTCSQIGDILYYFLFSSPPSLDPSVKELSP